MLRASTPNSHRSCLSHAVRWRQVWITACLAGLIAGCQSLPPASNHAVAATDTDATRAALLRPSTEVVGRPYTGTVADWPLFFIRANWGYACYNAQACMVTLGAWDMREEKLESRPVVDSTKVPGYPDRTLSGDMVGVTPFEVQHANPARVLWRAKDGTVLRASIDILEIFKDRLIRHETPREDVSPNSSMGQTEIILEVNDRTINVYSRTRIPTKELREPGNRYSGNDRKLIKVSSQTY